jgi:hypothetical protein
MLMKTKIYIGILLACFLVPMPVNAQLGSKLKQKLEKTMNKAMGREDTTQTGEAPTGEEREKGQFDMSGMLGGNVTAKYDDTYDFKGMMQMKTEMFNKGKPEGTMDVELWFNGEKGNLGMESRTVTDDEGKSVKATAIVDGVNMVMLTIAETDGGRSGIIMPVSDIEEDGNNQEEASDVSVRKTGNTKTICGYRCEEYVMTQDDGDLVTNAWVTDELEIPGNQKLLGKQQGMPGIYGNDQMKGALMASETYDKGELTARTEVTEVDLNARHTISVEGVSLMQMNPGRWMNRKNR